LRGGELAAYVTVPVLNDAAHKIMCSEAIGRFSQPRAGLVRWLKDHPERVRELAQAETALHLMDALPVELLPIDVGTLLAAQGVIRTTGLLASDGLILTVMRQHALTHLASNDDDFDLIPGLTVWKPR
jgi:predicted nucleic acid-binding protein